MKLVNGEWIIDGRRGPARCSLWTHHLRRLSPHPRFYDRVNADRVQKRGLIADRLERFFFLFLLLLLFSRKRRCCSVVRFMGMERWTGSHLRTWSPFRDSSIDGYDGSRWIERFLLWNFIQWAAEVGEIRIEAWVVLVRLGGLKIITDSKKNGKCKFSTGFYFRFTFAPLCLFFFSYFYCTFFHGWFYIPRDR